MIIYYSSDGSRAIPEISLGDNAQIMLSYFYMQKGPDSRYRKILKEIAKPNREIYGGAFPHELEHISKMEDIPIGIPKTHFFDSGSFSLWTTAEKYGQENNCGEWEFYETNAFWEYFENYVEFVKEFGQGLTHYANIDVLPFRKRQPRDKSKSSFALTWRNQKELEKRGLNPIPVVHYKAPMSVLRRYMGEGYDHIALGGLVGGGDGCIRWTDRAFDVVCDTAKRTPQIKVHGFGVTSFFGMTRYPWYSVDSTSWTKAGGFGMMMIPHKRNGKFVFDRQPYTIKVSVESPEMKIRGRHLSNINKAERKIVEEWISYLGLPLGEWRIEKNGEIIKESNGIYTDHNNRRLANLLMYENLRRQIKTKPFRLTQPTGFGLFH